MIDYLPKNGLLQKGQCLSLHFFERKIQQNIQDAKRRIRDIIEVESKRKGKRPRILEQDEYFSMYIRAHSYGYDFKKLQQRQSDENFLGIINETFINKYTLFYEPKWKVWFDLKNPSIQILAMLNHLAFGYFYQRNQQQELIPTLTFQDDYCFRLRNKILISFGTIKTLNNKSQFVYQDYIYFSQDEEKYQQLAKDPRRNFLPKELIPIQKAKQKGSKSFFVMNIDKLRTRKDAYEDRYQCSYYQKRVPNSIQLEQFQFEMSKYEWSKTSNMECQPEEQSLTQRKKMNQNQYRLLEKNLQQYEKTAKLVNFLEKIPNFEFNLSNQERQVIEMKGNIIVIGRSGTGKTTCALLKLFSLELFVKIRSITGRKFSSGDMEMSSPMRNIFLTASPLLTEQLKKQYINQFTNVKFELQKKQQQIVSENQNGGGQQNIQAGNAMQGMRAIMQKLRQNEKRYSFNQLGPRDFPCFFSLKNFLIMLDGVYNVNFFKRDEDKKLFGQANYMNNDTVWIKSLRGMYEESTEIDYESFKDFFWNNQILKHKNINIQHDLNPLIVWTEIFSVIEGSTSAYKCPSLYISEVTYQSESKNKFLTREQKKQIYYIFKLYKSWKQRINKYDLSDIVNFLLRKIKRNSYLGPPINFMFVDEVQDLTPATIYLITQIASNSLFYAGDTAQSISKGVSFKFSDIKGLFRKQETDEYVEKEQPQIKHLTVNFRSHNSILRMANTIIRIIQVLFPKTIDSLRKQISKLEGPKPIYTDRQNDIIALLHINREKQFVFTSKQVIIVRSVAKKIEVQQKYSRQKQKVLILTIAQCKGLQFEDVILWDFIDQKLTLNLWRVLDFLELNLQDKVQNLKSQALMKIQNRSKLDNIDELLTGSMKLKQLNMVNYHQLCSQLKLIYTALTRARQVLIIFGLIPKQLMRIWQGLNIIERYSQKLRDRVETHKLEKRMKLHGRKVQADVEAEIEALEWKKAGIQFFKKQNYEQALICFQNINDLKAVRLMQTKIRHKQTFKKVRNIKIQKQLGEMNEVEARHQENKIRKELARIAQMYFGIPQFEEAGRLYYQLQNYNKALDCFKQINLFYQMGQCYSKLKNHMKAADMYERAQRFSQMVNELDKGQKFVLAFIKLVEHQKNIGDIKKRQTELKRKILKDIQNKLVRKLEDNKAKKKMMKEDEEQGFQEQQQQRRDRLLGKRKILKELNNFHLPHQVLQELKIAISFQKNDENKLDELKDYMSRPLNMREIIIQLQDHSLYDMCLILGAHFDHYHNFEDHFVLSVLNKYMRIERQQKNKFLFGNDQYLLQEMQKLDLQRLKHFESQQNSKVITNLNKNLIFCGLFEATILFYPDKIQFYHKYLKEKMFLKAMGKKIRQDNVDIKKGKQKQFLWVLQKQGIRNTTRINDYEAQRLLNQLVIKGTIIKKGRQKRCARILNKLKQTAYNRIYQSEVRDAKQLISQLNSISEDKQLYQIKSSSVFNIQKFSSRQVLLVLQQHFNKGIKKISQIQGESAKEIIKDLSRKGIPQSQEISPYKMQNFLQNKDFKMVTLKYIAEEKAKKILEVLQNLGVITLKKMDNDHPVRILRNLVILGIISYENLKDEEIQCLVPKIQISNKIQIDSINIEGAIHQYRNEVEKEMKSLRDIEEEKAIDIVWDLVQNLWEKEKKKIQLDLSQKNSKNVKDLVVKLKQKKQQIQQEKMKEYFEGIVSEGKKLSEDIKRLKLNEFMRQVQSKKVKIRQNSPRETKNLQIFYKQICKQKIITREDGIKPKEMIAKLNQMVKSYEEKNGRLTKIKNIVWMLKQERIVYLQEMEQHIRKLKKEKKITIQNISIEGAKKAIIEMKRKKIIELKYENKSINKEKINQVDGQQIRKFFLSLYSNLDKIQKIPNEPDKIRQYLQNLVRAAIISIKQQAKLVKQNKDLISEFVGWAKQEIQYGIRMYTYESASQIQYMREASWTRNLQQKQIQYSLQILYRLQDEKQKNSLFSTRTIDESYYSERLSNYEYGRARYKISKIQQSLRKKQWDLDSQIRDIKTRIDELQDQKWYVIDQSDNYKEEIKQAEYIETKQLNDLNKEKVQIVKKQQQTERLINSFWNWNNLNKNQSAQPSQSIQNCNDKKNKKGKNMQGKHKNKKQNKTQQVKQKSFEQKKYIEKAVKDENENISTVPKKYIQKQKKLKFVEKTKYVQKKPQQDESESESQIQPKDPMLLAEMIYQNEKERKHSLYEDRKRLKNQLYVVEQNIKNCEQKVKKNKSRIPELKSECDKLLKQQKLITKQIIIQEQKKENLEKIQSLVIQRREQFDKGGIYFKKFMAKEAKKKFFRYFLGWLNFDELSPILDRYYSNEPLLESQLQELYSLSINQQNYVILCQAITLVFSFLINKEDLYVNFYQFTDVNNNLDVINQHKVQQEHQIFRSILIKILQVLKNPDINRKFFNTILGFFHARSLNEDSIVQLRQFCVIKKQIANKLIEIVPQLEDKLLPFSKSNELLIIDALAIQHAIAMFYITNYEKAFPEKQLGTGVTYGEIKRISIEKSENMLNSQLDSSKKEIQELKNDEIFRNLENRTLTIQIKRSCQAKLRQQLAEHRKKVESQYEKKYQRLQQSFNINYRFRKLEEQLEQKVSDLRTQPENHNEYDYQNIRKAIKQQIKRLNEQNGYADLEQKKTESQIAKKLKQINNCKDKRHQALKKILIQIENKDEIQYKFIHQLLNNVKTVESRQKKLQSQIKLDKDQFTKKIKQHCQQFLRGIIEKQLKGEVKGQRVKIDIEVMNQFYEKIKKFKSEADERKRELLQMQAIKHSILDEEIKKKLLEKKKARQLQAMNWEIYLNELKQQKKIEMIEKQFLSEGCPICFQELLDLSLSCAHKFHLKCIIEHLQKGKNKNCPLCRQLILNNKTVEGICHQCNKQRVKFKLQDYMNKYQIQRRLNKENENKMSIFCNNCTQSSKRTQIKDLYVYFSGKKFI